MKSMIYRTKGALGMPAAVVDFILFILVSQLMKPQGISVISPSLQKILWPQFGNEIAYIFIVAAGFLALSMRRKCDQAFLVALCFPLVSGLLTVIRGLSVFGWLRNYSSAIIALLILQICRYDLIRLIRVLRVYLEILIIINLIYIILYPTGAYEGDVYSYYNWFLGYKSSLQCYMVPCICLEWLDSCYSKKSIRFITMLFIGVTETILSHNAMLSMGMIILTLFIVFRLYELKPLRSGYLYIVIVILVNVIFVFFIALLGKLSIFQALLDIFNKTMTLSSRASVIWPKTLQMIADNPVFGHGVYLAKSYDRIFGKAGFSHAHNQFLQVLLDGGVFLLVIFFGWLLYVCRRLGRNKDLRSSKIFVFFLFEILLMATVEVYIFGPTYFATWLVLYLSMYTYDIDRQYRSALMNSSNLLNDQLRRE